MTKQLSPAAKAVLDSTNQAYDTAATVAEGTAVALRAAATAMQLNTVTFLQMVNFSLLCARLHKLLMSLKRNSQIQ